MRRHGAAVRRLLVVVLAAGAATCVGAALRSDPAPAGDEGGAAATPVWSVRRVPQPVVDAVAAQRLQATLAFALAPYEEACVLVEERGRAVAARDPATPLLPASTQKLLTGAAALTTLGPDFRFETRVVAPAPPEDGLVGRLWLVGAGDPGLSTPDQVARLGNRPLTLDDTVTPLADLADAVVAAGIRTVPGGVSGDDSRYDGERFLDSWPSHYRYEIGPLGALVVDDGFDAGTRVADPAVHAAAALTRLLVERGVSVGGSPGRDVAPPDAVEVASVLSPPLAEVVASEIRSSDNLSAELLVREVAVGRGQPGTTPSGTQGVVAALADLGLPTEGVTMVDGSGLDRGNRATCTTLLAALAVGERDGLEGLWDGLAVAGESGTLATRLVGTPLEGRLRAKTGSLNGVTGLVGLVDVTRPLRFALVVNGDFSEVAGMLLREDLAGVIASYPDAPAADDLVPAPGRLATVGARDDNPAEPADGG